MLLSREAWLYARKNASVQSGHIGQYIEFVECLAMVENNRFSIVGALRRVGAERGAQGAAGST